ncbi:hypothetical protein [Campylobacter sp. RM12637]|uniref:hypothetical protein n=1 Tax=Campylobacter sp. RM12637 TaxID=2735734 RepID=UPI003014435A|nr:hypothetical protein [Campylobacter sp. RM12637]
MKKVKNFLSKNKILGAIGLSTLLASSAQAAVTFDATKGFSGSVDLLFFYTCVSIAIGAMVSIWAVKKGVAFFK